MNSIVQINIKYTAALMYLTANDNAKPLLGFNFPVVRDDTNVFFEAKMATKAENQSQSWETRLWRKSKRIKRLEIFFQGTDDGE